jgi:hypothetical protein
VRGRECTIPDGSEGYDKGFRAFDRILAGEARQRVLFKPSRDIVRQPVHDMEFRNFVAVSGTAA